MEVYHYAQILNRRKLIIALTTLLTLLVVIVATSRVTPVYASSSLVRVAQASTQAVGFGDINYSERLIQTYVQLLRSRPFLQTTIDRLGLKNNTSELAGAVSVDAIANTELIRITVESTDPGQAANIANTLGGLLVEQGQKVYTGDGTSAKEILLGQLTVLENQLTEDRTRLAEIISAAGTSTSSATGASDTLLTKIRAEEQTYMTLLSQYDQARVAEAMRANSVSVVEQAMAPKAPIRPDMAVNATLGGLVGLLAGLGLALLFENLDPAVHSAEEVAAGTGLALLARIPGSPVRYGSRLGQKSLVTNVPNSPASEAFHMLNASLHALGHGSYPETVLVCSAEPRAGTSMVAGNLAAVIAEGGHQVIIVDGDVRDPCQHRTFKAPRSPGISDVIMDPKCLAGALHQTSVPGLQLLAAGTPLANPASLWNAPTLAEVVYNLTRLADVVIWDTPPLLATADTLCIAPFMEAILFVVAEDRSTLEHVGLALSQLHQVEAPASGIVYTRTGGDSLAYYDYYRRRMMGRFATGRVPKKAQAPDGHARSLDPHKVGIVSGR